MFRICFELEMVVKKIKEDIIMLELTTLETIQVLNGLDLRLEQIKERAKTTTDGLSQQILLSEVEALFTVKHKMQDHKEYLSNK